MSETHVCSTLEDLGRDARVWTLPLTRFFSVLGPYIKS